ncbi:MAG: hypothetical protein JWL70_644 [Acidimicrobiia bacterium]|nr:hypothetical protein [Acidimicrobiia bacterium]
MDQPFLTAGFLTAGFVGCLVAVGVGSLWPLIPAAILTLIGSVLLGFAGIAKPLLVEQLLGELDLDTTAVNAEVRWSQGRLVMVATPGISAGPYRVTADPGALPLRSGCAAAMVAIGALRDGEAQSRLPQDLVALLAPAARLRAVEAKPAADELSAILRAGGYTVEQRRTWLTLPPAHVVQASRG